MILIVTFELKADDRTFARTQQRFVEHRIVARISPAHTEIQVERGATDALGNRSWRPHSMDNSKLADLLAVAIVVPADRVKVNSDEVREIRLHPMDVKRTGILDFGES